MQAIVIQSCKIAPQRFFTRTAFVNTVLLLFAFLGLSACSSARINQFKNFSQAGIAYSEAANIVLKEAGNTVIDESSDTLILVRNALTADERKQEIIRKNQSDREFLEIFADIHRHTSLLRDYFIALRALAESSAPTEIGKSTGALYGSLSKLHPKIENASIAGKPVKDLIEPAVTLVITQVQQAALEKELRERAAAIERELALQHAAMKAVSEGMKARLEAILNSQESTGVVLPYIDDGKPPKNELPESWAKRRREILVAITSVEAVTAAAEAAKKLKMSFETLVKNEFSLVDLQLLLQDINQVLAVFEAVKEGEQSK